MTAKKKTTKPNPVPLVEPQIGRPDKYSQARKRLQVARLFYAKKSEAEIARLLGMKKADVESMLALIVSEINEQAQALVNAGRGVIMEELLDLLEEYRAGWEKSKEPRKTSSTKLSDSAASKRREVSSRTEERLGNPAYLQGIERVLKQISDLMGLNAPVKVAPTNPDGTETYKPYSIEDFGHIVAAARKYEDELKDGRSTPAK
jgi:hypothetical protein